jgi:hypothetical protein
MTKIEVKSYAIGVLFLIFQICLIRYAQAATNDDFKSHATQAKVIQIFTGVPASIQLAQAFCETNFGRADTIGNIYNNVFAIMDFDFDYWEGHNGKALGCWGRKSHTWRRYFHPLVSWLDHAYFFHVHAPNHIGKDWQYWCSNPPKYSGYSKYWAKIKRTIIKYKLYEYD